MWGIGVASVVLGAAILVIFLKAKESYSKNDQTVKSLKAEIGKLNRNESLLLTVDNRLTRLASLSVSHKPKNELFSNLSLFLVPDFFLSTLEMKHRGEITITGVCLNLQCLSNMNSQLEKIVEEKKFAGVSFPGVDRTMTGAYNVNFELKF